MLSISEIVVIEKTTSQSDLRTEVEQECVRSKTVTLIRNSRGFQLTYDGMKKEYWFQFVENCGRAETTIRIRRYDELRQRTHLDQC